MSSNSQSIPLRKIAAALAGSDLRELGFSLARRGCYLRREIGPLRQYLALDSGGWMRALGAFNVAGLLSTPRMFELWHGEPWPEREPPWGTPISWHVHPPGAGGGWVKGPPNLPESLAAAVGRTSTAYARFRDLTDEPRILEALRSGADVPVTGWYGRERLQAVLACMQGDQAEARRLMQHVLDAVDGDEGARHLQASFRRLAERLGVG